MANKSSFLLAVLFIANPFVLLFYQNCSIVPNPHGEINSSSHKTSVTLESTHDFRQAESLGVKNMK